MGIKGDIADMKNLKFKLGDCVEIVNVDHRLFCCRAKIVRRFRVGSYHSYEIKGSDFLVIVNENELKGV